MKFFMSVIMLIVFSVSGLAEEVWQPLDNKGTLADSVQADIAERALFPAGSVIPVSKVDGSGEIFYVRGTLGEECLKLAELTFLTVDSAVLEIFSLDKHEEVVGKIFYKNTPEGFFYQDSLL